MRIGLALKMIEGPDSRGRQVPRWEHLLGQATAAEHAGFDSVVLADAVSEGGRGYWESMSLAGALAASTTRIDIGHSVLNPHFREPAVTARAAETLDEISGGRYQLGIGAGNTPDDYAAFSMDAEPRYSRFAEILEVICSLLRHGAVDFTGTYERASIDWWSPRGPRPNGPPVVVAAGGPKMIDLAARLGDGWNWWGVGPDPVGQLGPTIELVHQSCERMGRDPATLSRSVDVYSLDPLGLLDEPPDWVLNGSPEKLAGPILDLAGLGVEEVRVDLVCDPANAKDAVAAMAPVVALVHRG